MAINRDHPDFDDALNDVIKIIQRKGLEINDLDVLRHNVEAIEIVGDQLHLRMKNHAKVQ
ncbi:hypothetical protein [Cardiobacterium sp. Marseille-Q4385]|jgi:hypothetical protein|uniref:hypothetical protein n=1 Tax=Cardiobacterium sp. Marseille-Q4385 TaxID=2866573 RepID=UPI001CE465D9|nr:hypothetical protein [Cardiobacterium sp. Marseille-Q4385]